MSTEVPQLLQLTFFLIFRCCSFPVLHRDKNFSFMEIFLYIQRIGGFLSFEMSAEKYINLSAFYGARQNKLEKSLLLPWKFTF